MEEEISLKDILDILKRRFAIIVAVFLLITTVGGALSFMLNEKEYSSSTSLLVGHEKEVEVKSAGSKNEVFDPEYGESEYETIISYGNTVISEQTEKMYHEIIKRSDLLQNVIDDLDLDITVNQLKKSITINIPQNSALVEIEVKGLKMDKIDEIADEVTRKFMELVFEITEVENIRVMEDSSEPKAFNTQNIKLNIVISAILGLMLGIFLAFIWEYLDDRIRTTENVEKRLKLDVIGEIPDNYQSEALRTIRTNIQFSSRFKDKKTLVMASPILENDNGKLCSELSNVIAEGNKKVLLIDSDLRNPRMHEIFEIANEKGLSNILLGDSDLDKLLNIYEGNNNLHILTSGSIQERPAELLSGDMMKEFLSNIKDRYDYIILNAHPIYGVADSIVLSALVDGVILVLNAGVTREKDVKLAKKALENVEANIIGTLLKQE